MSSVHIELSTAKLPNGVEVFYREAGSRGRPILLLLHGFPNSSFYFRNLIPLLADNFHIIAPDLPGFGFTRVPVGYVHTFASMGSTVKEFVEVVLPPGKFSVYIFDYGAPAGLRMALEIPDRIEAIVTQNGNAFEVGLGDAWAVVQKYWKSPTEENREAVRKAVLGAENIRSQYLEGSKGTIAPEAYTLDAFLTSGANSEVQLDLFLDYANNVAMYPQFQEFIRNYRPRILAVWGKNDPFFVPPGAEAWVREVEAAGARKKDAEIHFLDTGHFALETQWDIVGAYIREFFNSN